MVRIVLVPSVYLVTPEVLKKACARVHPEKSLYMVPLDIALTLVDEIREMVPI
jgi:hypothetical protein